MVGCVAINTGTIPSKALREAILYMTGHKFSALMGSPRSRDITVEELSVELFFPADEDTAEVLGSR